MPPTHDEPHLTHARYLADVAALRRSEQFLGSVATVVRSIQIGALFVVSVAGGANRHTWLTDGALLGIWAITGLILAASTAWLAWAEFRR